MFSEEELEEAGLEWFRELGYTVLCGPDIAPDGECCERSDYGQVVLEDRLRDALYRINSEVPVKAIEDAMRRITIAASPDMVVNNRNFQRIISDGIDVEYQRTDGSTKTDKVWLFDEDDLDNNDWAVVNQFAIKEGKNSRRPDIIVFINGLPLAIFELKSASKEKATINKAYNQLQTYKREISSLFNYSQLPLLNKIL